MLTEIIVVAFVAIGLVAIAVRFVPRDEHGARRLPRVIDESIGMAAIRSVRRRPAPKSASRAPDADATQAAPAAFAEPSAEEIAYRIGAAGAPAPTIPTHLVVSRGALHAHPPAIPVLPPVPTTPVHGQLPERRRLQAHPASSLGLQRRIAGAVAASAVAIAMLAVVFVPRGTEGGVLSATGMPSNSAPNAVAGPSSEEYISGPSPSASAALASPSAVGSSSLPTPTLAAATPTPVATRRPTPTPARTPKPTPKPPTPTPAATADPGTDARTEAHAERAAAHPDAGPANPHPGPAHPDSARSSLSEPTEAIPSATAEAQLLYSRRFARGPMNGLGPVGAYIAILSEVGLVLLITILAGVLAGVWVDSQLRTGPIFLLVGLGLGLTGGFIGSYRLMTRFMSRYD